MYMQICQIGSHQLLIFIVVLGIVNMCMVDVL